MKNLVIKQKFTNFVVHKAQNQNHVKMTDEEFEKEVQDLVEILNSLHTLSRTKVEQSGSKKKSELN